MPLEAVTLEHLPHAYTAHLALFCHVENAAFLHQQLLARNAHFEYAFIDASIIFSRKQLFSAIFRATLAAANNDLKTPNVHSEIVTGLSPSNNISDAYRRFGITPLTKHLVVVRITFPDSTAPPIQPDQISKHLEANVQGRSLALSPENLAMTRDIPKIRKYYKLNGLKWLDDIKDEYAKNSEMETLILNGMALRGV